MTRCTAEEKMYAVRKRFEDGMSFRGIAAIIGVNETSIRTWCRQYESLGAEAFTKNNNRKYSKEFKTSAVEYYLNGNDSLRQTCKTFCIPETSQLRDWIRRYNNHNLKASPEGKVKTVMKKSRKTTLEERIRIVEDHLQSNASYAQTAEKYDVSYQQVYRWIQKYKTKGTDGLIDRRGRSKLTENMTEIEKLQAENRILKAQLERKELENIFLKKVDEIERRRS